MPSVPTRFLVALAIATLAVPVTLPPSVANHEGPVGLKPIDLIFGGSLRHTSTHVLLVPPAHGDLGNPLTGPDLQDYIDATLRGIRKWETVLDQFAAEFPQYSYLSQITVDIEVFDGVLQPPVGQYDVVIAYVETGGGQFRGLASDCLDTPRCILLSLFSNSPRVHQSIPDYPEVNDLETVTMHEFAHTWGLGHTLTWTTQFGPDLMNSPATFIYGDGNPLGDGGERTPIDCISSLDLYGMAVLYRWVPTGPWQGSSGSVSLPGNIPYKWYC